MSYADAQDYYFGEAMTVARYLLNPATIPGQISAHLSGFRALGTSPGQALANRIENAVVAMRGQYDSNKALARAILNDAMAWVCQEIGSEFVKGGAITSEAGAFHDFRAQMVSDLDYINARDVTADSDPTKGSGLNLRRLTLGYDAKIIEGGKHAETVTAEVVKSALAGAGSGRARVLLKGEEGPEDSLDYQNRGTDRSSDVYLELYGDSFPGLVPNSTFVVSGAPANGATVSADNLGSWTQEDASGTPTTVWDSSTTPWRDQTGGVKVSGNSTTKRYYQYLQLASDADAFRPIDIMAVIHPSATFQGTVTISCGNISKAFAHGVLSLNAINYLHPDLDENLYPINADDGDVKIQIDIAITAGDVVLYYLDVQQMEVRQGWWYAAWSHTADPTIGDVSKDWTDTCDYTGETQDTICVAYDEQPYAYMPTTGTNLITSVDS